ncbi:MAG: FHA domain-containing protein [Chloroflexia bacterium]|nr:FHA domain-containing protein [Chloroflexia bacterium]
MNALVRFEELIEDLLEGSLAKLMRSPVQPAEIARRLERAMEQGQRAAVGQTLVPNRYRVLLHPDDYAGLEPARGALEREMARFIVERVRERGFDLLARPQVSLEPHEKTRRRRVRVQAELADTMADSEATAELEWTQTQLAPVGQQMLPRAWLRFSFADGQPGQVHLDRPQFSLGRARDNDIILDDPRVSRYHARIVLRYGQFLLQDLHSTYGSLVNGEAVEESILRSGDVLSLGGFEMVYEED